MLTKNKGLGYVMIYDQFNFGNKMKKNILVFITIVYFVCFFRQANVNATKQEYVPARFPEVVRVFTC